MDQKRHPHCRGKHMKQMIDGVFFEARDVVNPLFLKNYGTVFYVFDYMDSGNLCFGVKGRYGKLFIKYAGAAAMNAMFSKEEAVSLLKNAMPLYESRIPSLVPLLNHGPVPESNGYAAVFRWIDAPCLRPYPPDKRILFRLRHLPLPMRLSMLDDVFQLHVRFAQSDLLPVDFDESNLLIDFASGKIYVCDVDRYQKGPFFNKQGRMPGHGLLRAPEEYEKGALIDERTAVYNMGMLAMEILGDPDHPKEHWDAPAPLHETALCAIEQKPFNRFPTLGAFLRSWRRSVGESLIL